MAPKGQPGREKIISPPRGELVTRGHGEPPPHDIGRLRPRATTVGVPHRGGDPPHPPPNPEAEANDRVRASRRLRGA